MDLIFNELSGNFLASDEKEASCWMYSFFETANAYGARFHKPVFIRTTTAIKNLFISPNYTLGLWLHTIQDKDYLRKILNQLTNKTLLSSYPYYSYQKIQCVGLGFAHKENKLSISYPEARWQNVLQIEMEFFDEAGEVKTEIKVVNNLCSETDVEYFHPRLIFEHHKKHDNRRPNLNDGESTLNYYIPEENKRVQKLLDCSFGKGKHFNWDENCNMFIEFQYTGGKVYHAYHIIDQNRVPNDVKIQINEFKKV